MGKATQSSSGDINHRSLSMPGKIRGEMQRATKGIFSKLISLMHSWDFQHLSTGPGTKQDVQYFKIDLLTPDWCGSVD